MGYINTKVMQGFVGITVKNVVKSSDLLFLYAQGLY